MNKRDEEIEFEAKMQEEFEKQVEQEAAFDANFVRREFEFTGKTCNDELKRLANLPEFYNNKDYISKLDDEEKINLAQYSINVNKYFGETQKDRYELLQKAFDKMKLSKDGKENCDLFFKKTGEELFLYKNLSLSDIQNIHDKKGNTEQTKAFIERVKKWEKMSSKEKIAFGEKHKDEIIERISNHAIARNPR